MAAQELDGVDEAGVESGGPAHPRRPHAPFGRKSGEKSRSHERLRGGNMVMINSRRGQHCSIQMLAMSCEWERRRVLVDRNPSNRPQEAGLQLAAAARDEAAAVEELVGRGVQDVGGIGEREVGVSGVQSSLPKPQIIHFFFASSPIRRRSRRVERADSQR